MASAILDIDLEHLPEEITGLSAYGRALVLVRVRGRPVAQVTVPVHDGRLGQAELADALVKAAGWHLWKQWIHDYLGWEDSTLTRADPPTATVAICTRDRSIDLRRCLDALLQLPDDGQEIIVIDNCPSNDATKKVVESCARVRYVLEPRKGLDVARNRAVREARHGIVAFVDDDAMPDRGWLRALLANFDDPMVEAVTGLTIPVELETDAQETHERLSSFNRGFERRVFDARRFNPAAAGQIGAGVNMAIRRSVFDQIGLFDEALDAGTRSRSGGDTEMLARILLYGYRIVYEPRALCRHRHRRTWRELRQMFYGYGIGVYAWWTSFAMSQKYPWMIEPAAYWLFGNQIPALLRGVRHWHRGAPLDLAVAELAGCAVGPWAYAAARRTAKREIAG